MNTEKRLRKSAEDLLEELLSWWSEKVLLPVGFQGRVKDDGQAVEDAPRGLILGARLLWTYSAAYRVTGKKAYLASAEMLYHYLKKAFFDHECGGAFFEITHDGKPLRDYKHVYAEAFVIYALSEFYRASGREEALSDAYQFFDFIEKAHDDTFGGYFEVLHRDGTHAKEILGTNQDPAQEKTMNTSLHIMEALTALLRVKEDKKVRARLKEMFEIFLDKIVNPATGHFFMFFDRAWHHDGFAESYGHDIEGSWLIAEAAEVLGERESIERAGKNALFMADAVLKDGMAPTGALESEYDPVSGKRTDRYSWWEQNEAVVGSFNAYQISGEEKYIVQAEKTLDMILSYHIDRENGGYFPYLKADLTPMHGDKANMWICPYHNGRMAMELLERTNEKE